MCGICGLLAPSGRPDPALAERMNAALVHRGPDEGSVDQFGRCVLGHRRLQVIDLATGSQPVANEAGDVVAVFNGELYNFQRPARRARRRRPRGPRLRRHAGDPAPLRGGRAGLRPPPVRDVRDRALGRGPRPAGARPRPRRQEAAPLDAPARRHARLRLRAEGPAAAAGVSREVDPAALDAYLALQYVPGGTALRGVEKLPPGHVLVAEGGSMRVEPYWQLEPRREARSDEEWLELVRETVGAAVRRRLVADVPLGALLSGGIDSSIVVAEMAKAAGTVRTFTVGFGHDRYDERAYARAVAERYATEHEEIVVEPDLDELLPRLAQAYDEPLGDEAALPQFVVSELAAAARDRRARRRRRRRGLRGLRALHRVRARAPAGAAGGGPGGGALRRAGAGEPRSAANRAGRLLEVAATPAAARYGRLMEVFPAALRAELWEPEFVADAVPAWRLLGPPPGDGIGGAPAARRAHVPPRRPAAQGRHRLDGALARAALAAPRPRGAGARRLAARPAEDARPARQGRPAAGVRGRAAGRGRRPRKVGVRRPARPTGSAASCAGSRPTCSWTIARGSAASCARRR